MKYLANPTHFTFTNHFNQSLLKTRIAMMNKKTSFLTSLGKYLLFVPVFCLVVSFSKPYIIKSPSRYLVQTENSVEWVITPKITLADLAQIKEAVEAHGGFFNVTSYQLDPLELYIQRMTTQQRTEKSSGSSMYGNVNSLRPIRCVFFKLDLKTNIIHRYDREASLADLQKVVLEDRAEAEKAYNENALEYELRETQAQYEILWDNIQYLTATPFPETQSTFYRVLAGKSTSIWKDNLSGAAILKEALKHTNAFTRIDRRPVAHEDISKLDATKIKDAFIFDHFDEKKKYNKKTYVLIHTIP